MKLFHDPRFNNLFDGVQCLDSVTNGVHAVLEVLTGETFDDEVDHEELIKYRRQVVREIYQVLKDIAENGAHKDILANPFLPVYRVSIDGVQRPEEFVDRRDAVVFGYDAVQKIIRERKQTGVDNTFQVADPRPTPTFEIIAP